MAVATGMRDALAPWRCRWRLSTVTFHPLPCPNGGGAQTVAKKGTNALFFSGPPPCHPRRLRQLLLPPLSYAFSVYHDAAAAACSEKAGGQPNCRKKRHLGGSVKNLKYLEQRNGSIMFPVSKFSGFFRALTQEVRCQFSDEQADWAQSFLTTKKRNSTESSVVTHKTLENCHKVHM